MEEKAKKDYDNFIGRTSNYQTLKVTFYIWLRWIKDTLGPWKLSCTQWNFFIKDLGKCPLYRGCLKFRGNISREEDKYSLYGGCLLISECPLLEVPCHFIYFLTLSIGSQTEATEIFRCFQAKQCWHWVRLLLNIVDLFNSTVILFSLCLW